MRISQVTDNGKQETVVGCALRTAHTPENDLVRNAHSTGYCIERERDEAVLGSCFPVAYTPPLEMRCEMEKVLP